ncbi:hypothetical protein D9758_019094 [Tetrapyrgos nigripes]|uniref:Uncharacterized protein n=1 Tax=Tetrapyrgos nigripes TaxID=182062 RepID=A0A8H5EZM6_9AGAR|nr:hypothetical protein D9758_019094 [Tetrapyrgos nigripes]
MHNASLTFEMMLPASLLFTNFIATSTIGYKTCSSKIHLEDSYKHNNGFKVEQILIILLESGIVYCFLWILVIVTKTSSVIQASYQVGAYVGILMPHAAINMGKKDEEDEAGPSNFTMSLRFGEAARSPSASTIDIAIEPSREMESRGSREMDEVDDGIGTRSPQAGKNLDMIELYVREMKMFRWRTGLLLIVLSKISSRNRSFHLDVYATLDSSVNLNEFIRFNETTFDVLSSCIDI